MQIDVLGSAMWKEKKTTNDMKKKGVVSLDKRKTQPLKVHKLTKYNM